MLTAQPFDSFSHGPMVMPLSQIQSQQQQQHASQHTFSFLSQPISIPIPSLAPSDPSATLVSASPPTPIKRTRQTKTAAITDVESDKIKVTSKAAKIIHDRKQAKSAKQAPKILGKRMAASKPKKRKDDDDDDDDDEENDEEEDSDAEESEPDEDESHPHLEDDEEEEYDETEAKNPDLNMNEIEHTDDDEGMDDPDNYYQDDDEVVGADDLDDEELSNVTRKPVRSTMGESAPKSASLNRSLAQDAPGGQIWTPKPPMSSTVSTTASTITTVMFAAPQSQGFGSGSVPVPSFMQYPAQPPTLPTQTGVQILTHTGGHATHASINFDEFEF